MKVLLQFEWLSSCWILSMSQQVSHHWKQTIRHQHIVSWSCHETKNVFLILRNFAVPLQSSFNTQQLRVLQTSTLPHQQLHHQAQHSEIYFSERMQYCSRKCREGQEDHQHLMEKNHKCTLQIIPKQTPKLTLILSFRELQHHLNYCCRDELNLVILTKFSSFSFM